MLTQRIFSNSKCSRDTQDNSSISQEDQLKSILKKINKVNTNDLFFKYKSPIKQHYFKRNNSSLTSTTLFGTSYKKPFKVKKVENSLLNKLKDKITKETLILELREELKYHIKFNATYKNFLNRIIQLKEIVKENRDKVQHNTDLFKETYKDKYNIILQYEKTIVSLAQEKINIEISSEDTIKMKQDTNKQLLKEYSEIEQRTNKQKEKIQNLTLNICDLEYKKSNLNEELQRKLEIYQKNYEHILKLYKNLIKKYNYYKDEYNSFAKTGEEMTKIDVKLFDETYAKDIILAEDLDIKFNDELIKKSYLIDNINNIKAQIKLIEDKQKEEKEKRQRRLLDCKIMGFNINKRIKNKLSKNRKRDKACIRSLSYNDIILRK